MAHPRSGSSSTVITWNWNLEMLVFVKGGKPEYRNTRRKTREIDENQQQTQPTPTAVKRSARAQIEQI